MKRKEPEQLYQELFPSEREKAAAFDRIAQEYYFRNFGEMAKADLETLLFSVYLERILETEEENSAAYSDYTLSKHLGITQEKVRNLKVRKELKYPYAGFDWRHSFARIYEKARMENGKIRVYISDRNLFLELQNFIQEERDLALDMQLNSSMLVLDMEAFWELVAYAASEEEAEAICTWLKQKGVDAEKPGKKLGKIPKETARFLGERVLLEGIKGSVSASLQAMLIKTLTWLPC